MIGEPVRDTVAPLERPAFRATPLVPLPHGSTKTVPSIRRDPPEAFLDRFARILRSGELGWIEPEPAILEPRSAKAGPRRQPCAFADGNQANLAAARALGSPSDRVPAPDGLCGARADFGRLG